MAKWTVGAARDLPVDTERSWDGADAAGRMLDAAGFDGDQPNSEKARRGFLMYDAESPDLRGSYSLPFADLVNGRLTALASGLRASASRLPQKDGVSDAVRSEARAVLDAYFKKIKGDGQQGVEETERSAADEYGPSLVWATPAPITRLYTSVDQPAGSVSEPYAAAVKMAGDPSIFETNPPYFFRAHISNSKPDSYFTRMHESTLKNYADDASAGVSFQNSHRETELGFGRSIRGEFMGTSANGTGRTEADFYTIPGLNLNGVSTDDLIAGMRAGLVKDVSVGFYGGTYRCAICQRALFTGDCRHIPGLRYNRDGSYSDDPNASPAIAWVHDARLAEVSAVYDGSCPGAAIMKARQMAEAGHLQPAIARVLEARYRIRLPAAHPSYSVWAPDAGTFRARKDFSMTEPSEYLSLTLLQSTGRAVLSDLGIEPTEPENGLRRVADELKSLRAFKAEHEAFAAERERLTALADVGRQYQADLLEETLSEGVRADGPFFRLETQRALLANASIDQLKTLRDGYKERADRTLSGGRLSADRGDPDPEKAAAPTNDWTPKGAYAG